ncbi:MAG: type II secretion system F family protein [Verrucomicrobiota bacterium]
MSFDLLIVLLVGMAITLLVIGVYSLAVRRKTLLASRVDAYVEIGAEGDAGTATEGGRRRAQKTDQLAAVFGPYLENLAVNLNQADMPLRPVEFVILQGGLMVVGLIVGSQLLGFTHSALILGFIGFLAPMGVMRMRQYDRRVKFSRQLANALMLLASSLRSGYSFIKGIELVAAEMDDPMAKELKRALREIQIGSTVDQALMSLSKRVANADMEIVVCAYLIQREVGGNLTELMERVAETVRERFRIRGDIRTLTAQGRLSGIVVSVLPFALCGIIAVVNPTYFEPVLNAPMMQLGFWSVSQGVVAVGMALLMQGIGAVWIYRIVSIKV